MRNKVFHKGLFFGIALFLTFSARSQKGQDSVAYHIGNGDYLLAKKEAEFLAQRCLKQKNYIKYTEKVIQISDIYRAISDNEKALKVLFAGLKTVQKHGEKVGEIAIYRNISGVYSTMHDTIKSSKYIYTALARAKKIDNDSILFSLNQPLYLLHSYSNSDSTKYYLERTMLYSRRVNTPDAKFMAYNNYFSYLVQREQFETAKKYLDSASTVAFQSGNKKQIALIYTNRGAYYYWTDNFQKAKLEYDKLFALNPQDTTSMDVGGYYYTYADILYQLGQYKQAYLFSDKAFTVADMNYDTRLTKGLADVAASYQIAELEEKRRAEKAELEHQNELRERIMLIFIAVIFITLILFYFFYQNSRLKQKNKLQELQSITQQNLLSATLDARETERKQIASVLHDSISAMLSSAGLQLTAFSSQQGSNDEITKTRQILKEAHDKVRDLSHELVPTLLAKFGLAYALEDLCEKFSTSELQFKYKDDGTVKRYDEDFETRIYFITSELLNNVIKHSGASKARLTLTADNELHLSLKDNGKGFDTSKPDGFGLTQIKARISAMKGKVMISSKPGTGTEIKVSVPLH
ncbi:hypothetical protein HUK80_00730 [Flavobacterium sp. MAH-1]|uniref:Oxygen sensor histidine kinase NreB n=1 Tax=Flavobacterium agri TaxID=2743471 RepID=A0A7Y8XYX5_9FLAO|nr:ATP-binding protein [Flavobacterium agri]NUY79403.1 hypothetical protein [Flavobacterium agri]NYA69428.1 hypothetical protein [Flavobacterium agri]